MSAQWALDAPLMLRLQLVVELLADPAAPLSAAEERRARPAASSIVIRGDEAPRGYAGGHEPTFPVRIQ